MRRIGWGGVCRLVRCVMDVADAGRDVEVRCRAVKCDCNDGFLP